MSFDVEVALESFIQVIHRCGRGVPAMRTLFSNQCQLFSDFYLTFLDNLYICHTLSVVAWQLTKQFQLFKMRTSAQDNL